MGGQAELCAQALPQILPYALPHLLQGQLLGERRAPVDRLQLERPEMRLGVTVMVRHKIRCVESRDNACFSSLESEARTGKPTTRSDVRHGRWIQLVPVLCGQSFLSEDASHLPHKGPAPSRGYMTGLDGEHDAGMQPSSPAS